MLEFDGSRVKHSDKDAAKYRIFAAGSGNLTWYTPMEHQLRYAAHFLSVWLQRRY